MATAGEKSPRRPRNRCFQPRRRLLRPPQHLPHRAGPLCRGRLPPLVLPNGLTGMTYTREGEILKCPWHQWEFDIKTGQTLYDPKLRVRTNRVEVEDDQVVLYD